VTLAETAPEAEPEVAYRPASRAGLARYAFAALSSLVALATMLVFEPLIGEPVFAFLVGAVAVTVWYGGFGPGILGVVVGWSLAFVIFVGEPASIDRGDDDDLLRWGATVIVALGVAWVSIVMRRGRERAATAADVAEASFREMAGLQELATTLSAGVTPSDVAHALVERTPALLGARGGSLGLIDGAELVIVDPLSPGYQTHQPGFRLSLRARAPIAQAAASGVPVRVPDRETFEREFPDGAALTLYAQGAIAVPLRAGGEVVGSMSFLYDEHGPVTEEAETLALIAADMGGQALERARLYDRERESRRGFDRILRVAPRFHTDSIETASAAICREAVRTFGADLSVLWRLRGHRLELVSSEPPSNVLVPGLVAALEDFPRLLDAVDQLEVSFVPDIQDEARGEGLERIRQLGIHSSLRTPIAIGGSAAELLLTISWEKAISEPDTSTFALAQRFADQAGFALEQVERRRAEAEAARSAEETRRLQEITAALSVASTVTDVSNTCLQHALAAVGAEAGFIVLSRPEGVTVDVVTSSGYSDTELDTWRAFALDADVPFSRAIATGEAIWALTPEEMGGFAAAGEHADHGWAALPLTTPAGIRGALHLSFRTPRTLTEAERRWLQTVVSQCAQALERSRLFDAELLLRRRSERLQSMTAALSNALTRQDVAAVAVTEIGNAVGSDGTALASVVEDRQLVRMLAWRGYPDDPEESWLEVALDAATPGTRALRRRVSGFYETIQDVEREFPDFAKELGAAGHTSFLFVPLVAGRRANALLVLSWKDAYPLTQEERRFVETLAGQVAQALDRATHLETEQTIAETLQRSVLPVSLPRVEGVQLAARYLPGTAELDVGGDWFDAIPLPDDRLGLVVGDVVGKGVEAAATMSQLRNALRAFSLDRMKPATTMARLNRLAEEVVETAFATMVYVVVDPAARICRITSAGHPPPLVMYPDGRVEFVEGGRGLPLGAGSDTKYGQAVIEMPVGTALLLYTDGLVERRGRAIDEGLDDLRRAAADGPREPEQLVEHILERLVGTAERGDDIALLAVRLLAVAPKPLHLRVQSELGSLELVRDALRVWLAGAPMTRAEAHDVVLAVWEACANSIEHALDPVENYMDVRAELTGSRMRIVVEDTGQWTPPTERVDRGLGLRLIRATMSSVEVTPVESGTRVTIEKALAGAGALE
jgi:serine phosphatase RsbU (regulator of sigma subunit)/anti-sigma regulatory factor (Ser/Thr protein kinase)